MSIKATLPSSEKKPLSCLENIRLRYHMMTTSARKNQGGWIALVVSIFLSWAFGGAFAFFYTLLAALVAGMWLIGGVPFRSIFSRPVDIVRVGNDPDQMDAYLRFWRNDNGAVPVDYRTGTIKEVPKHPKLHQDILLAMREIVRSGSNAAMFRYVDTDGQPNETLWHRTKDVMAVALGALKKARVRRSYADVRVADGLRSAEVSQLLFGIHEEVISLGGDHPRFWIYRHWDAQEAISVLYVITEEALGYSFNEYLLMENESIRLHTTRVMSGTEEDFDASDEDELVNDYHRQKEKDRESTLRERRYIARSVSDSENRISRTAVEATHTSVPSDSSELLLGAAVAVGMSGSSDSSSSSSSSSSYSSSSSFDSFSSFD